MVKKVTKKKVKKNIPHGVCHIHASFNNTIVTFTDPQGNAISWASAGQLGFRGSKNRHHLLLKQHLLKLLEKLLSMVLTVVMLRVKGPGAGRENAIRALLSTGIRITSVSDKSPIPHNGCRAPKRRRV